MGLHKETATDILLDSVVCEERVIPINEILNIGPPRFIRELHLLLEDSSLLPQVYGVLNDAFNVNLEPNQLSFDQAQITETDHFFAEEFGYRARYMAVARVGTGAGLEVWIGPTLTRKDHPLVGVGGRDSVFVAFGENTRASLDLVPEADIVAGYYLRTTVKDKPSVLADVCEKLGENEINICEIRQPETKEGSATATIAVLVDPCPKSQLDKAVEAITKLETTLSVDSVFKVVGHPTRDISKPYSNRKQA